MLSLTSSTNKIEDTYSESDPQRMCALMALPIYVVAVLGHFCNFILLSWFCLFDFYFILNTLTTKTWIHITNRKTLLFVVQHKLPTGRRGKKVQTLKTYLLEKKESPNSKPLSYKSLSTLSYVTPLRISTSSLFIGKPRHPSLRYS